MDLLMKLTYSQNFKILSKINYIFLKLPNSAAMEQIGGRKAT